MARTTDKEAKKKQIMDAALKVFARTGLNKFKMADIATEAGVGKGTLYEYFRTKEELMIGSISQFMSDFEIYVASQIETAETPVAKIESLIESSVEFCLANKDRIDAMFDFYSAGIPHTDGSPALIDLGPRYKETIRWVSTVVTEGIEQGVFKQVDPVFTASMIMAMLDGLFFQAAVGAIGLNAREISEKARGILMDGLLCDKSSNNDKSGE